MESLFPKDSRVSADLVTYKITIEYDGTPFKGWQRQEDLPTVQAEIEKAVRECWGTFYTVQGSGRTDTGVHALGQVAHFRAPKKFDAPTLQRALNNNLPRSIRIVEAKIVSNEFHARFNATGKEYIYRVFNHPYMTPFELERAFHVPRPLDIPAMRKAAEHFIGKHDFASYTSNPGYARHTTVRKILKISIVKKGDIITFRFRGEGFLYRMVRNLMGALIKVGLHRLTPADVKRILEARSRQSAPNTSPACGLYLAKVFYTGKKPVGLYAGDDADE